jgi:alpha-beta hydrolase superfamily lysophospholipase
MTYWSAGVKVIAYVTLPTIGGPYPMYLHTHGGYALPNPDWVHLSNMVNQAAIVTMNASWAIKDSQSGMITLVPMYRGYGESNGTVQGLVGDTLDSNNAITALKSYLNSHKNGPQLEKNHIYLYGESFGGGVALKLASERKDIVFVEAISPFVGWDLLGPWYKQHDQDIFNALERDYGSFNPNSPAYKKRSIDYKKIKVPVLLVQGTDDPYVPWQTVQQFYIKMKSNHKNVTFKLIEGGNHDLVNKPDFLNEAVYNFGMENWKY